MQSFCGYIALIGAPNAGKSTLMNQLVGGKVSIVTHKVQTTRKRVRGVLMQGAAQLVFIDTPGIFEAKKTFEKSLVDEAWAGVKEADAVLLLIDAQRGFTPEVLELAERMKTLKGRPVAVALNKVDQVEKPYLLKLATLCSQMGCFDEVFMISALKNKGTAPILAWLADKMPEGPYLYETDALTDQPMRELAAEITREKLFLHFNQELPYSLSVETEAWEESEKSLKISQVIKVEREGQKKIIIGDKGEALKRIGKAARTELEAMLGRPLHLALFVKVDAKWKSRA